MSLLANLLQTAVKRVQESNRNNPDVRTADSSIFDKLKDKLEDVKNNVGPRKRGESTNLLDQLRNRIDEVKRNNEADPNVDTADNSVFDDMKRELEELKAKIAAEEQAESDARIADLRAQMEREEQAKEDARLADIREQIKLEEEAKAEAARRQREAEEEAERKRRNIPTIPTLDDLSINTPSVPTINTPNIPTINTPNVPKLPSLDDLNINQPSVPDFPKVQPRVRSIDVTPTPPPPSPKPNFPQQPAQPRSIDVTPPPQPTNPSVSRRDVQNAASAMTNSMGGSLQLRSKPDMGAPMTQVFVPDNSMIKVLGFSSNSINLDGKDVRFALVDFNGQQGWTFESYLNFK